MTSRRVAVLIVGLVVACAKAPPSRPSCAPERGRDCSQGVCIDGRCYLTCEGGDRCVGGEGCFSSQLSARCFSDRAGERRLCATAKEVGDLALLLGGDWTDETGHVVFSQTEAERVWLKAVRPCATDGGCRALCFSDAQCPAGHCDCVNSFVLDSGVVTGQCGDS